MKKGKEENKLLYSVERQLIPTLEAAEKDAYSTGGGVDKRGRHRKVGSIGEQRGCNLLACLESSKALTSAGPCRQTHTPYEGKPHFSSRLHAGTENDGSYLGIESTAQQDRPIYTHTHTNTNMKRSHKYAHIYQNTHKEL